VCVCVCCDPSGLLISIPAGCSYVYVVLVTIFSFVTVPILWYLLKKASEEEAMPQRKRSPLLRIAILTILPPAQISPSRVSVADCFSAFPSFVLSQAALQPVSGVLRRAIAASRYRHGPFTAAGDSLTFFVSIHLCYVNDLARPVRCLWVFHELSGFLLASPV